MNWAELRKEITGIYKDGDLVCSCGYNGQDGWNEVQIDQDERSNDYYAWECPVCHNLVCLHDECPPDEFGQTYH